MKEDKIHEIEIELDIASADSASANSLIDVLKKYRKKMLYLCVSALILISGFAWLAVSRVGTLMDPSKTSLDIAHFLLDDAGQLPLQKVTVLVDLANILHMIMTVQEMADEGDAEVYQAIDVLKSELVKWRAKIAK